MDALHVVKQVPAARKSIPWDRPVTAIEQAKMRVISVAVQSMGFTLVPEKTSVRREVQFGIHTGRNLAAIRLQMGVQVFAARG